MAYQEDRSAIYLGLGWVLTAICLLAFGIRFYSRTLLTRSVGSDDFAIAISVCLTVVGQCGNVMQVINGFGKHQDTLTSQQYLQLQKWEQIDWIMVFISFFFVRTSVILFVLRLLPVYKKWQKRVIYVAFAANLAICLISTVSYGLACIPFKAWYTNVPNAKCFSKHKLVVTNQVNGILSCLIDVTTAVIPQFLLWKVEMKRKTKISLNVMFALGLITAALSIGRVAALNDGVMTIDSSWRIIPSSTFSLVEEKCGIIVACSPAIRQFFAYRKRTGSYLPNRQRQPAGEDFVKMRRRVNIRDLVWYRKPTLRNGRVLEARPIFQDRKTRDDVEATAHKSVPGEWRHAIARPLHSSSDSSDPISSGSSHSHSHQHQQPRPTSLQHFLMRVGLRRSPAMTLRSDEALPTEESQTTTLSEKGTATSKGEKDRIGKRYREWGLLRNQRSRDHGMATQPPFLNDDSAVMSASRDIEVLEEMAADPRNPQVRPPVGTVSTAQRLSASDVGPRPS